MLSLTVHVDGDRAWPELKDKLERGELVEADRIEVAGLRGGMSSGNPSVALRFDLPDGTTVIAQTSLRLFLTAADALKAAHGDPRYGNPN